MGIEEGAIDYKDSGDAPEDFRCLFVGRRQRDSDGNLILECDELGADNTEANRWHTTAYYTGDMSGHYCWYDPHRINYNIYVYKVEETDISDPYPTSTNEGDQFDKLFDNAVSLAAASNVISAPVAEAIQGLTTFPNDINQSSSVVSGDDGDDDEKWHWDMALDAFPEGPPDITDTNKLKDALPVRLTASTWNSSSGEEIGFEAENSYYYDNLNCGATPYSGSSGWASDSWTYDVV